MKNMITFEPNIYKNYTMIEKDLEKYIILYNCQDSQGIVAKITNLLFQQKINIISMEEHVENNIFFMRIVVQSSNNILNNNFMVSTKIC